MTSPVCLGPFLGTKDNSALPSAETPSSNAGPGPRVQGRVWGEHRFADLVLGILMGILKQRNRHSGHSCPGLYSLFSRKHISNSFFQIYLPVATKLFYHRNSYCLQGLLSLTSHRPPARLWRVLWSCHHATQQGGCDFPRSLLLLSSMSTWLSSGSSCG